MAFRDEQRLAFGSVAELYDRARPSYPPGAIDDVIAHAGLREGDTVLEVGAGTGKATVLLAQRGLGVLALEPSAEMASVARDRLRSLGRVRVVETEFERWEPLERFPAVVSVQAWHWIQPELRYARARAALVEGGTLAAIWTLPDWRACSLTGALGEAYRTAAPHLTADFPMHPASEPSRLAGDWEAEVDGSSGFTTPVVKVHRWNQAYTSGQYLELLQTHQDHILLSEPPRRQLLAAIAAVIENQGAGVVTMPYVTRVCLATRR